MGLGGLRFQLNQAHALLAELRAEDERKKKESKAVRARGGTLRLYEFVRRAWHILEPNDPFQDNWHIGAICEHLEAVTALEILSLIINIPPRHGKSLIVSVFWFAWVWTMNPYSRWIYSTYSDDFAKRDGQKSRDVVTSGWYQSEWGDVYSLRGDQNAKEKIQNDKQGFRLGTTIRGKATGEGGSYFVVDDPMKVDDADSVIERQRVIDWWTGTVSTRGNDPKTFRRVVVMQRLHERDLSGYLMAESSGYEQLVIPVEYEPRRFFWMGATHAKPKDPIILTKVQMRSLTARDQRKHEGELLWPARFDEAAVRRLKIDLNYHAAGQLQQRPSDPEGSIFRRSTFKSFHIEIRNGEPCFILVDPETNDVPGKATVIPISQCRIFQCADTAVKIKKRNDYTAVVTAFLCPGGRLLIYDVYQCKLESPHLMKFMRSMRLGPTRWDHTNLSPVRVARWPLNQKIPVGRQYIEDAASGSGLLQTAAVEGTPMKRLSNVGDKVEKAIPLATMYEAGLVYHLAGAAWRSDFEDEIVTFPNAAHDDRTDAAGSCGRVSMEDRALRLGMADLVDVGQDYPEFVEWQRQEEEKKKLEDMERNARENEAERTKEEVLASLGMEDKYKRKKPTEDDDKPEPRTYRIRLDHGELEIPND
jgi:predicted phage terminase large subunit-like protein